MSTRSPSAATSGSSPSSRPAGQPGWDHRDCLPVTPTSPAATGCRSGVYEDPAYQNHPAVAVSWWSAYALARSQGGRLPSSLEWEAAARGFDGRLFPWGDEVDVSLVNCADSWSDHPLITYRVVAGGTRPGRLADALPGPVNAHPGNVSPFGVGNSPATCGSGPSRCWAAWTRRWSAAARSTTPTGRCRPPPRAPTAAAGPAASSASAARRM